MKPVKHYTQTYNPIIGREKVKSHESNRKTADMVGFFKRIKKSYEVPKSRAVTLT